MFNSNYNTSTQTSIPVQRSFFGPDKYLADTRRKLAALYFKDSSIVESEKRVILEYWKAYDGLSDTLGDKLPDFTEWFLTATSPETITRSLRALKEDSTIQLSPEKEKQRQEREQQYRSFWGNEKQLRGGI